MTQIRSFIYLVFTYGLMAVMGLIGAPLLLGPRSWARGYLRIYLAIIWFALRWICGVRFEVRGREHLPEGGALIASKHQSMWETLAFWGILPDPAIILKKSLVFMPFFGWFAVRLGNISIDRKGGAKALRKMLRDAAQRGQEGRQVLIFPEGTRVEPGDNPELKPGIVGLYQSMKVPCVPVALNSGVHLGPYCGLRKPGLIVVEFLPPIEPGLDKAAFMTTLHARISAASDALLSEAGQTAPGDQT